MGRGQSQPTPAEDFTWQPGHGLGRLRAQKVAAADAASSCPTLDLSPSPAGRYPHPLANSSRPVIVHVLLIQCNKHYSPRPRVFGNTSLG